MSTDISAHPIDRRTLLRGAVSASALAAVTPLCAARPALAVESDEDYASRVDEVVEADVIVVGAGASGLVAAVQAGELGADTLLLEAQPVAGGNANILTGVMGVGSAMAKAQGVEVTPAQIVTREVETFTYRVDGLRWQDLVEASGANVDWLVEHGVEFAEQVTTMNQPGALEVFHAFLAGEDDATSGLASPLLAAMGGLPVELRVETAGKQLIMEDGAVAGVYAVKADGSTLEARAKAVIIATGGYGNDTQMLEDYSGLEDIYYAGLPGHSGDGIKMALSVGAKDTNLGDPTLMLNLGILGVPSPFIATDMQSNGKLIWVNNEGKRYVNEACILKTSEFSTNAARLQEASYGFCDTAFLTDESNPAYQSVLHMAKGFYKFPLDNLDAVANTDAALVWKADTVEELAELSGLGDGLVQTVNSYNEACEAGFDPEFLKDPSCLVPLTTPPFYVWKNGFACTTTLGGVHTDRLTRVLDGADNPIPGLYAAGVDGCELYKTFYTLDTPGSCNANNVNTGRVSARQACAFVGVA